MNSVVFVCSRGLVDVCRRFRRTYCLRLQGERVIQAENKVSVPCTENLIQIETLKWAQREIMHSFLP
jgi:hypothetical protein